MNILTVCDQGNNRSVQFAHLLKYKYKGSDAIAIGLKTTTEETLQMLYEWADVLILTEEKQLMNIPGAYHEKVKVWDVGEDRYPRPFNIELYEIAKQYIKECFDEWNW